MNASEFERDAAPVSSGAWRLEGRALLTLALPLVLTEICQMSMGATDMVMMGWLGAEELAAGALANHFYGFFVLIATGIMSAVAPLVAQALGARQFRAVRRSVRQGLWAAAAVTLPSLAVLWHSGTILVLLGQDPAISAQSQAYLRAMIWGLLPALWYLVLAHFLAAHSRPRAALVVTLVAIVANAGLNYVLMFGHFGLPAYGLVGAGISTALVDCLLFLGLLIFVLQDRRLRRYHILARIWRPDWARFRELFRIGLPIGLAMLAEIGLFLGSTLLIGRFGADQLAAHGLAIECVALAYMVPYGIGQAAAVRVGLARGRADAPGVRLAAWSALTWGFSLSLAPAICFWFLADRIVGLFLDGAVPENAAAVAFAVAFLKIAAFFQAVDAAQVIASGALRGLKDTRVPMLLAILGYWVCGLGAALFFAFELGYEGRGAWMGLVVGLTVAAPLMLLRLRVMLQRL